MMRAGLMIFVRKTEILMNRNTKNIGGQALEDFYKLHKFFITRILIAIYSTCHLIECGRTRCQVQIGFHKLYKLFITCILIPGLIT